MRGGREQLLAAIEHKWGTPVRGKVWIFDRWIYPEAKSHTGEAVRISVDDRIYVEVYVDPVRDDPYGARGRY